MKFFAFLCFLLIALHHSTSSWLSDIFSGLDEDAEDASGIKAGKLQRIFVEFEGLLRKNIGKWKGNGKHANLLSTALHDDKHLKALFKTIMKQIPDTHHLNFIERLNNFLIKLSKQYAESVKSNGVKNLKKGNPLKFKDSRKFKKHLKDAVKYVNKHLSDSVKNYEKFITSSSGRTDAAILGEKFVDNYVSKRFQKPHHLSVDDKRRSKNGNWLDRSNSATGNDNHGSDEIQMKPKETTGSSASKGSEDNSSDAVSFSKLTDKQKVEYLEAERQWEMKLAQETQRLLDKLEPADAYIIPDLPVVNSKNSEDPHISVIDGGEAIKSYIQDIMKRKSEIMTEKKKWEEYKQRKDKPLKRNAKKRNSKVNRKRLRKLFEKKLASEEIQWIKIEQSAIAKLKEIEQRFLEKH